MNIQYSVSNLRHVKLKLKPKQELGSYMTNQCIDFNIFKDEPTHHHGKLNYLFKIFAKH